MDTFFASPVRAALSELSTEIEIVNHSPVVSGLLQAVGGLLDRKSTRLNSSH